MKKGLLLVLAVLLSCVIIFAQGPEKKIFNDGTIDYLPLGTKLRLENEALNPETGAVFYSLNFTDSQPYNEALVLEEEGQFWLSYATQDVFGLISPVKHYTAIVDGTAPVFKYFIQNAFFLNENNETYVTSNTNLIIWGEDTGSGTENIFIRINDAEYIDYPEKTTLNLDEDFEDGEYQIESYLVDYVGNTSDITSKIIYLDNTAPEVEITCEPQMITLDEEIFVSPNTVLNFIANDEGSGVKDIFASINGSEFASVLESFIVPEKGENLIQYYAVDNLGNASEIKEVSFSNRLVLPETELFLDLE